MTKAKDNDPPRSGSSDEHFTGQVRQARREMSAGPHEDSKKTETAKPRATPIPRHVVIEGCETIREFSRAGRGVALLWSLTVAADR